MRKPGPKGKPPSLVLCAGLKSSGSTWLYNVAIRLAEAQRRASSEKGMPPIAAFYADSLDDFPGGAAKASILIVKTHIPAPSLQFLTAFARGRTLLSVREPRDAIASLMLRFHHEFELCLSDVSAGAQRMLELRKAAQPLVFRYEDRFYEDRAVLDSVAAQLDFSVSRAARSCIFRSLQVESVRKTIRTLAARGRFGPKPNPDSFHPKTHWHPGHVGDTRIGKHVEVLSAKQQQAVLMATRDYCLAFNYEVSRPPPKRRSASGRAAVARRKTIP
jgi:hypothetical protein